MSWYIHTSKQLREDELPHELVVTSRDGSIEQVYVPERTLRVVYLVEISDELLEDWLPFGVYLHRETAEDCAESMRKVDDGVQCYARVTAMKVVDG